ncbi:MAG TPA: type II toxin-antitoxin system Phd/YefM family antitoxin [Candidatus Saccharimonadales bacterium]|jgi:prevent-host-death family protein
MTWQLQEAKNKLSEVVETSRKRGPQIITRRGHNAAVVMSFEEYQRLTKPKKDLKQLLRNSGFHELDLTRDKSPTGRATPVDFNSPEFGE